MLNGRTRTHRIRVVVRLLVSTYLLTLIGCAARQMPIRIERQIAPNPETGHSVHIALVEDRRAFEVSRADPVPHQLVTEGVEDPAIRARSIAQLWGGNRAVVDFLLPEGQSAALLIRNSLAQAFRGAGFIVLESNDPGFAASTPVNAEILRFWSWMTGTWTFTFEFETVVMITADIPPFEQDEEVRGYARLHSVVSASERSFRNTTNKGLDDFVEKVSARLEAGKGELPDGEHEEGTDDSG